MWTSVSKHVSYAYYVPAERSSWYTVSIKAVTEKELTIGTSHEYQHQIYSLGTIMQLRHGCFFKQERLPRWLLVVKNPPANGGDVRDVGLIPGLGRFPWRRAQQPTPVCLPGESHGRRSLEGCPVGFKEGHDWSDWACTQASNKIIHSCHGESREQRKCCHGQRPNSSLLKTH